MTERYARIEHGEIVEVRNFGVKPDPNPAKKLDWRRYPVADVPPYDPATQTVTKADVIEPDQVREVNTVIDKTAKELAADADANKTQMLRGIGDGVKRIVANQENRLRALEGLQPLAGDELDAALLKVLR